MVLSRPMPPALPDVLPGSARRGVMGGGRVQAARLGFEHHRDAIPHRVAETVRGAAQFDGPEFVVTGEFQRPFADGAYQEFDQALVHRVQAGERAGQRAPLR